MNCLTDQLNSLQLSLEEDLLEVATLQTKLNEMRRSIETRAKKDEIEELKQSIGSLNANIEETRNII